MKYLKVFKCLVLGLVLCSCEKNIDLVSDGIITTDSFYKSENDFRLALNAIYTVLNTGESGAAFTDMWIDATTDDATTTHSWNSSYTLSRGTATTSDSYATAKWQMRYQFIQRCNTILGKIESSNITDEAVKKQIIAEATVLRGYFFYDLAMFFDRPVIILETPTAENAFEAGVQAENRVEVLKMVYDDMKAVIDDLPEYPEIKSYLGQAAGYGYFARVASALAGYTGDDAYWTDVLNSTNKIISMNYSLDPDFNNLFINGMDSPEPIFIKEYSEDYSHQWNREWAPQSIGANNVTVPTKALIDAFEYVDVEKPNRPYDNKDPRMYVSLYAPGSKLYTPAAFASYGVPALAQDGYFYYNSVPGNLDEVVETNPDDPSQTMTYYYFKSTGDYADLNDRPVSFGNVIGEAVDQSWNVTPTGFSFKKYQIDQINYDVTWNPYLFLRLAEFKLLKAEALVETGGSESEVKAILKEIRERGGNFNDIDETLANVYGGNLLDMVRNEKRVEFAFEGQRPYDIRRWGIFKEVCSKPIEGVSYRDADGNQITKLVVPASDREIVGTKYETWPIPQTEIDINATKGNVTQNANWL